MDLDGLLARVIELGGSDMHLKVASPAMARVDGELVPLEERLLNDSDLVRFDEYELRDRVEEAADEPSCGGAVDVNASARHPFHEVLLPKGSPVSVRRMIG